MDFALIAAPIVGIAALLFAFYKASSIDKVSPEIGRASCRERV